MELSEWITIKSKRKTIQKKPKEIYNPTFQELKDGILKVIVKYNPYAVYLYGSRARGNNTPESDVDIMVVWTQYPADLDFIKKEIIDEIKIKIDFVNLVYKEGKKEVKVDNQNDIEYYNNVLIDEINIYKKSSQNIYLKDIIPHSIKLPKVL